MGPADQGPAATHSAFAELICADPGLMRAEFEALIAANYPPGDQSRRLPPRRPARPRADRVPPTGASSPSGPRSEGADHTSRLGTVRITRERGPPDPTHGQNDEDETADGGDRSADVQNGKARGATLVTTMIH